MADSFWFWSNITDISSMEQNIAGVGGGGGYNEGQEQEMMMMMSRSMMKFDDQTTTTTKKTKPKKCGRTYHKKPEKKNPKRGVGIAKLEETIKQKNSQLAAAADRQVYHGYPTTASLLPTTTYNDHSHQPIQLHHDHYPFLHNNHQHQKQTSTISSSSVLHGAAANGGQLNLNHVPNTNIHNSQVMNYGSSSTATNVNGGLNHHHLMLNSHAQQSYALHHQNQKQHGNNEAGYYNPNAGSAGSVRQHGNNGIGGYNSRPEVVELSSTQKQQQHSDHIFLNNQKNLNSGENIGGFTRYSKTNKESDFLEFDLRRNWNNNNNNVNGRQINKEFTSSSSSSKASAGLLPTGYSGVTTNDGYDQVELLAVHRKGKSSTSSSSSILMEYEFLSLTNGGIKGHQYYHTRGGYNKKADYDHHQQYYSSNYSSSSCLMEESAACSSARNGAAHAADNISSSSQSNTTDHDFLDLSLKLSSYH